MYTSPDSIELPGGTKRLLGALWPITWLDKAFPRDHMTLIIYKLLANWDGTIRRSVRVSHDQFTPKFLRACCSLHEKIVRNSAGQIKTVKYRQTAM